MNSQHESKKEISVLQNAEKQDNKPLDHWAWVRSSKGKSLHCVPDVVDHEGKWSNSFLEDPGMDAVALCGRKTRFFAPGIFTRMHAKRCDMCCDALGLHHGYGTPRNERQT